MSRGAIGLIPIYFAGDVVADQWAISPRTALLVGEIFTALLYAANDSGFPTSLQATLGTYDLNQALPGSGVSYINMADLSISRGLYWLGGMVTGGGVGPQLFQALGGNLFRHVPRVWTSLGAKNLFGQCDYSIDASTIGLGNDGWFAVVPTGIASFNNGADRAAPANFPAYTGRINSPATFDVGTVNQAPAVVLHIK